MQFRRGTALEYKLLFQCLVLVWKTYIGLKFKQSIYSNDKQTCLLHLKQGGVFGQKFRV